MRRKVVSTVVRSDRDTTSFSWTETLSGDFMAWC